MERRNMGQCIERHSVVSPRTQTSNTERTSFSLMVVH